MVITDKMKITSYSGKTRETKDKNDIIKHNQSIAEAESKIVELTS